MDIIVSKVYDKLRFAHFIRIKYDYPSSYSNTIIDSINKYSPIKFYNLKECEINYLQERRCIDANYIIPKICKLEITNNNIKSINMEKIKIRITKVIERVQLINYLVRSCGYLSDDARNKINGINGKPIIVDVPNVDVEYLKTICEFTIKNDSMEKTKTIPSYLDNERTSCIDISPQPGDEPKQELSDLFHVKFTKVIHFDEMLNERQIQALLKDEHVKSINIDK